MTDLEQRLAALEQAVERLTHPIMAVSLPEMDEADVERFRREFEAVAHEHPRVRLPVTMFDPEMVRVWLRECVTVVGPGETLVVQVPTDTPPSAVGELQKVISQIAEDRGYSFGVLIVPGDGMAVAEAGLERRVASLERAVASLTEALVRRGDISINDGRAALGLKAWDIPEADAPVV